MTSRAKLLGQGRRSVKEQLNAVLWENGKWPSQKVSYKRAKSNRGRGGEHPPTSTIT